MRKPVSFQQPSQIQTKSLPFAYQTKWTGSGISAPLRVLLKNNLCLSHSYLLKARKLRVFSLARSLSLSRERRGRGENLEKNWCVWLNLEKRLCFSLNAVSRPFALLTRERRGRGENLWKTL
jgi:hypothetical protein